MYKMPVRNHILTVAVSIILASVIFSGILLKNNLDVVKNSKSSIALQQINVQELSTALGNLQFSVNLYIIFRRQSSLDSVRLYEKMFKTQSDDLYHTTLHNSILKKQVEIIHSKFPIIINQLEYNLKKLPPKITADNVKAVFNESGSPFSVIWVALSQVRSYQNQSVKTSTNETIAAGSRSWSIAIMGSIFLMVVVLLGCIYINKIYKNWLLAEAKEKASVALRKENEKLLQGVIDNCTAAIFIKDKSSKFIFVNKNFKQIHELGK